MTELPPEVRALFERANFTHLATLNRDGSPSSTAIWAGLEGDDVVFFTGEESLKARNLAESIVDTVREPLVVVDGAARIVSASRSFYQRFRTTPEETVGCLLYALGDGQWDIPALRDLLETVLPNRRSFDDFKVEHEFPIIGRCMMLVSARCIVGTTGETQLILLSIELARPVSEESA